MRSHIRTGHRWAVAGLALILLTGACGGDSTAEADGETDSSSGAIESGTSETGTGTGTDSASGGGDSAPAEDSTPAVVGTFEVDGAVYEFGWVSCLVEEIPDATFPTKIVNGSGTDEFPTMSLSITSTPSPVGASQGVRVTLPEGTYLLAQTLDPSGAVTDDVVVPGTAEPLFDPNGGLASILIDRPWQILDGLDPIEVDARLNIQCPDDALGSSSSEEATSIDDDTSITDESPIEEPTADVVGGRLDIDLGGERFESNEVICIAVPFSETVIINAWGSGPAGEAVQFFISNDPDDPEVNIEGDGIDIRVSPDLGDTVDLERTDNGLTGQVVVTSGARSGETLDLTVECDE